MEMAEMNDKMVDAASTPPAPGVGADGADRSETGRGRQVSRRQVLAAGGMAAVSVLGRAALASDASANTLQPRPGGAGAANPHGRFAGKVVLVTGATSGIGRTTAESFAREGAKVMFCGRRETLGAEVEAGIRAFGGEATYMRADVRSAPEVQAFVDATVATYGRLDIAFNNAGIFMNPTEVQDTDVDNFLDILATNAAGVFFAMKYELPHLRRQGGGVIVNMASVAGHKGFGSTPSYNASKHAVIGLTKAAAVANAKHNVRINSLSPLAVDTPMLRESFAYQGLTYEQAAPTFVTPRIMTTDEIARVVMFLAADEATAVNGMDLDVTGGQLA
jgi:NAD(P)-dependent dehydrogenase (short-subunit alcohol dehydrogenase family)